MPQCPTAIQRGRLRPADENNGGCIGMKLNPERKASGENPGEELYVWSGNVRYNSGQDRMAGRFRRFRNCEETQLC